MKKLLLSTAVVAVMALSAGAAQAATATGTADAKVVNPICVRAGQNALNFGSFAAADTVGTVTVDAAGAATYGGGVVPVPVSTPTSAGEFGVTGEAGEFYTFEVDDTVTLTDGGANNMTADLYSAQEGPVLAIDAALTLVVEGKLAVAANQAPGSYAGTYQVTAVYE